MDTAVSTRADTGGYRSNLEALRRAQKPSRGTAAYGRYVNRPLGRRVAAAGALVGLTPNAATAVSAALSASGILLLALLHPSWFAGLLVAFLLAAGYVMDSVDGQLARLTGRGSVQGEWLDHTVDCVKTSSLHLAVAIAWYRFPPAEDRAILLIPLGFSVIQATTYFGLILMPFLREKAAPDAPKPESGDEHPLRKWLILPTDYGFLCWAFVLIGWPDVYFVVYTALFALSGAMLILALRKWWRELGMLRT